MAFSERLDLRSRTSRTYQDEGNERLKHWTGSLAPLHYEGVLDSGAYDAEIDCAPLRVQNAQLDGWTVTANSWHYALGQPAGKSDGWIGFGGRQGAHWVQFRLARVGYLHQPTRDWYDIGGAPAYTRANLTNETRSKTLGPTADTLNLEGVATWANLWTTPGGGALSARWRVNGDGLKEDLTINQAGREWIAANRPPSFYGIPASEAYFGFVFQLDWSDIPRVYRQGVLQNLQGDFADDGQPLELRDSLDRLLAFMPLDNAIVRDADGEHRLPLRKRFYHDTDGNDYLAVGILATDLATLPAGDIVFDPSFQGSVGAGTDDARVMRDISYIDDETAMLWGGVGNTGSNTNYGTGARWTNVTIPKGAAPSSASITMESPGNWTNVVWRLTAIDEDNTATFSSGSPPGARAITSSYIAAETLNVQRIAGTDYTLPSTDPLKATLGNAVGVVVNRSGWASGNALAIVCNSDQDASASETLDRESFRTYDYGAAQGAVLDVTYTDPTPVFEQVGFRFFNDDGDEDGHTPRQSQNVDDSNTAETPFRLRFLFDWTNDPASAGYSTQWRKVGDPDSEWRDV